MNALIITAALIVQTWGGEVHVTEGLSDSVCEEARCIASEGMTCAESKTRAEAEARTASAEAEKHYAECLALQRSRPGVILTIQCNRDVIYGTGMLRSVWPSDTKLARCVK